MLNIATKELNLHKCKPNCFEKTDVRWDFFYFIAPNVLQLGAVCVGLWEGNCAKVLLAVWFLNFLSEEINN